MSGLRLAWRNLLRNRSRTRISLVAVALGTAVLILSYALTIGMMDQLARNVVDLGFGEAQVHAPKYVGERNIRDSLPVAAEVVSAARANGISASARSLGQGLLAVGQHASGAQVWGVDPAAEAELGTLTTHLAGGSFLSTEDTKEIVLGSKLARSLSVEAGGKVAMIVQAVDGSISTEMFLVRGVLLPVGETVDATAAIIGRRDFAEMFVTTAVHEVALSSHGRLSPEAVVAAVVPVAGNAEARTWRELLPAAAGAIDIAGGSTVIVSIIFLLAAGIGVLNTMIMAAYERIPELGIIKALGATPGRIVRDVATEAFLLGLIGTALGGVAGLIMAALGQHHGISLGDGVSMSGIGLSVWKAKLTVGSVLIPILAMWSVALLASLYPAWKASRLDPIKAIAHT